MVLCDNEGRRDSKGENPAGWPPKLHKLNVRELPTSNGADGEARLDDKGITMAREVKQAIQDEPFPLEAYEAVYCWIGRWAEESQDPEHRVIAEAAHDVLTVVGNVVLEAMRRM